MAAEREKEATGEEEVKLVVIDLNETFYNKSSMDEFFKFICSKEPSRLRYIFEMAYYEILKDLNRIRQTEFKENFFNYLNKLRPDEVKFYAEEFWRKEFPNSFNKEILNRLDRFKEQGVKIVCATGGLELYVQPLLDLYPMDALIGTKVRYVNKTYLIEGRACKGEEKVRKLNSIYKGKKYRILETYSDREEELFRLADKAYIVKKGILIPFETTK